MRKEKGYGKLLTTPDGRIICHVCGKCFHDLAKHLPKHEISAVEYKERFGLNERQALISKESSSKRRENALRHPELIERLKENNKGTRFQNGNQLAREKRRQWHLSQQNKQYTRSQIVEYSKRGKALGKSGLGAKAMWAKATGYKKTIEDRVAKTKQIILFERQAKVVFELCTDGDRDVSDEFLYANFPKAVVDEVLKRELDWLADESHILTSLKHLYMSRSEKLSLGLIPIRKEDSGQSVTHSGLTFPVRPANCIPKKREAAT